MTEIRKPALGRVADSRLTAEFIASDPRFAGCLPFDPAVDVDIVDEMNAALQRVEAATAHSSAGGDITFTNSMAIPLLPVELALASTQDSDEPQMLRGLGATVRALDGEGNPIPGGLVRLAGVYVNWSMGTVEVG